MEDTTESCAAWGGMDLYINLDIGSIRLICKSRLNFAETHQCRKVYAQQNRIIQKCWG